MDASCPNEGKDSQRGGACVDHSIASLSCGCRRLGGTDVECPLSGAPGRPVSVRVGSTRASVADVRCVMQHR